MAKGSQRTSGAGSSVTRRTELGALQERARACVRCPQLAANRTTVVFGAGNPDADVLFVGEAPGQNEDRQGLPLVGSPGRLIFELLAELGIPREDVYIANVLKCRTPNNRDALAEEIAHCREYLDAQVELIRPRVVCSLGNFATKVLRGDPTGIKRLHGQDELLTIGGRTVRLLPLLHPAAALYQAANLDFLRADLAKLPGLLALPVPPQPEPTAPEAASADERERSDDPGDATATAAGTQGGASSDPGEPDDPQLGLF